MSHHAHAVLSDATTRDLFAQAFARIERVSDAQPHAVFALAAQSWAISRAMAGAVALAPTLQRLQVTMELDAPLRAIESLTLHFDGGIVIADLEDPDDWHLYADEPTLRRLADQLALAAPAQANVSAEARLEAFAEALDPLLRLLLSTGEEEFTVERPAPEYLRAA